MEPHILGHNPNRVPLTTRTYMVNKAKASFPFSMNDLTGADTGVSPVDRYLRGGNN